MCLRRPCCADGEPNAKRAVEHGLGQIDIWSSVQLAVVRSIQPVQLFLPLNLGQFTRKLGRQPEDAECERRLGDEGELVRRFDE